LETAGVLLGTAASQNIALFETFENVSEVGAALPVLNPAADKPRARRSPQASEMAGIFLEGKKARTGSTGFRVISAGNEQNLVGFSGYVLEVNS